MWSTTPNTTPESDIRNEHLRVLHEFAISDNEPGKDVAEALDYLENVTHRYGGIRMCREGLKAGNREMCAKGLRTIRRNLGLTERWAVKG